MKLGIMLIVTVVGACGSVNSPVTEDAAPGNDAPSNPKGPGELVWARSTSAMSPYRVQLGAGGLVVAGSFNAPSTIGANTFIPVGDYDMALAGFAADDAAVLYAAHFGGAGYEAAFVDTLDNGGAPILHGITSGTVDIGTGSVAGGGGSDTFIGRYGSGSPAWTHRLATAEEDKIIATSSGPGGTVYATGYFVGSAKIGTTTLTGTAGRDAMLFRFNTATGALDLAKQFNGPGRNEGSDVVWQGSSTYLAGMFDGTMPTAAGNLTSAGGVDAFVAKLDNTGEIVWIKSFGGTGNEAGPRIGIDSAGDLYIAGTFQNQVGFGAINLTSAGSDDVFLTKLRGSDGAVIWAISIGATGSDNVLDLAVAPDGKACVIGNAGGALNIGGGNQGGLDAFLACYEGAAQLRWKRVIGTLSDDRGWGLTFGSDAMLYATLTVAGPVDLGVPLIGPANPVGSCSRSRHKLATGDTRAPSATGARGHYQTAAVGQSGCSEAREPAYIRWLEREDDPVTRNTLGGELGSDAFLGTVVLNPDLTVDQVDVNQSLMHAFETLPTNIDEEIAVALAVGDDLAANVAIGTGDRAMLGENSLDQITPWV